ncbi:MAG: molybdenum cofactor biosynthesis protein MoaE [Pseudomonadales bacterium]|nr:molybdenum cofactor biosynthesis protein MoaE [Pseudomonadales bacterium]
MSVSITVQEQDFNVGEAYEAMRQINGPKVGAIAAFVGLVRDQNVKAGDGTRVNTLTLEHYPGMTESSIQSIADKALARWQLQALAIYHRVGELQPMDQIVMVMASSGHREDAFAAAQFVMDYLKTDAVFWKKELTESGSRWIESTRGDQERAKDWQSKP